MCRFTSVVTIISFAHMAFLFSSPVCAESDNLTSGFAPCRGDPFFPPWKWAELEVGESCMSEWGPRDTNGAVYAFAVFNGELIAAGAFTEAGGDPADYIARWDGDEWHPLGSGVDNTIYALTLFNGDLIAGGAFTQAGGGAAGYVAKWNGASWSALPEEPNDEVHALTVFGGDLIAAGRFTQAGGDPANYIAAFNGTSWDSLGSGLNDWAVSLSVHDGNLIVGGWFTEAGGSPASYIASWNGASWSPLGGGMNWGVYALRTFGGKAPGAGDLVAGGLFTRADDGFSPGISVWDGVSWAPVGTSGMNHGVYGLAMYGGDLIAGGSFTQADTACCTNRIACWNGTEWERMGYGMDNDVWALDLYGTPSADLIAGGEFVQAGDGPARHVAKWDGATWEPVAPVSDVAEDEPGVHSPRPRIAAEPNPFWESVHLSVPDTGLPGRLEIFDVTGRLVRTLNVEDALGDTSRLIWDGKDTTGRRVASGVYFVRVTDDSTTPVTRIVRIH